MGDAVGMMRHQPRLGRWRLSTESAPAERPPTATPPAAKPPIATAPRASPPSEIGPMEIPPSAMRPTALPPRAITPRALPPRAMNPRAESPSASHPRASVADGNDAVGGAARFIEVGVGAVGDIEKRQACDGAGRTAADESFGFALHDFGGYAGGEEVSTILAWLARRARFG